MAEAILGQRVHERRLAALLAMDAMGPAELKRAIPKVIPRELAYMMPDGTIKNARELLASEGNSASGLIPTEVYATIMEGSEPARCMRNVIPIYQMKSAVQKIPLGETGTYAPVVAEGAEIPALDEVPTVMTFTASKYAVRPNITSEMVSDCTYDVISRNVAKAGMRVENALNQLALSAILEASGTAVDGAASTSDAVTLADLAKCISGVVSKGFNPTDIVFHPTCYGSILAAFTALATNTGDRLVNSGQIGSLLGCNTNICAVTDTSPTYTWGWGTNDYIGALVFDRNSAGGIGMREDINVENYRDPIRDLFGMTIKARFDAQSGFANATYRLQY